MAQPAQGNNPNNLPVGDTLGEVAYWNFAELLALTGAVYSLEQLRGHLTITAIAVVITDASARGIYIYDASDTTTADDGFKTLVAGNSRRYIRMPGRSRAYTPVSSTDAALAEGEHTYDATYIYYKIAGSIRKIAHIAY